MPILAKTLRDLRAPTLGFGLSGALMAVFTVVLYPSIRDQLAEFDYPEEVGQAFGVDLTNLGEPRVFFSVEFFSWIPLLLLVYVYRAASAHLAGEEESGTLDVLLAQPVRRARVYLETLAGIALGAVAVCAICAAGFAVAWPTVDVEGLALAELIGVCFLMFPFLLAMAGLTLLAGASASSRGWASGAALGSLVGGYLLFVLSGLSDDLTWLQYATPFYYAGLPTALTDGVTAWRLAVLLVLAAGTGALGLLAFERREIGARQSTLRPLWRSLLAGLSNGRAR